MFADGEIVRVVHKGSGWPGIGGLIVVQCDKGGTDFWNTLSAWMAKGM